MAAQYIKPMTVLEMAPSPAKVQPEQAQQDLVCTREEWVYVVEKTLSRISMVRRHLVRQCSFAASLVLRLAVRVSFRYSTMATDGRHLIVNPDFLESLTLEQASFVLAHEALHCALGHPWRRQTRDPKQWNVACDLVVNAMLISAGLTAPKSILHRAQYAGQCAEEVYADLDKRKQAGKSLPERRENDITADHETWDDDTEVWPYEKDETEKGEGQAEDVNDDSGGTQAPSEGCDGVDLEGEYGLEPDEDDEAMEDNEDWDGEETSETSLDDECAETKGGAAGGANTPKTGASDGLYAPDEEEEEDQGRPPWEHESDDDGIGDPMAERGVKPEDPWKSAMAETVAQERMRGTLPEVVSAALDSEASIVDWRQELAGYFNRKAGDKIRTDWSRMRKYRTANGGKYWLPRTKRSGIKVACLVDVSGSTDGFRQQFVSEVVTLLKDIPGSVLDVVLWTHEIVEDGIYQNVKTVADLPLEKIAEESGGTDVRAAMQWVIDRPRNEEPDVVVVFTDGWLFGDYTKNPPRQDVVWVITIPGYYQHPWGKVVKLDPHR